MSENSRVETELEKYQRIFKRIKKIKESANMDLSKFDKIHKRKKSMLE